MNPQGMAALAGCGFVGVDIDLLEECVTMGLGFEVSMLKPVHFCCPRILVFDTETTLPNTDVAGHIPRHPRMRGLSPVAPYVRIPGLLCAGPCGGKDAGLDGVGEMGSHWGVSENILETK